MVDSALELASVGFSVFPLHPRTKTPITGHGFKDATNDAGQIRSWWASTPDANIGVATEAVSGGLIVIDVDVDGAKGKDGMVALNAWQQEHRSLPPTLTATTGRGGVHLYYRSIEKRKNTTNAEKSVDIRADGGYVVAPPIVHENGNEYRWNTPFNAEMIAEADENTFAFIDSLYVTKSRSGRRGAPEHVDNGGETRR